MKYTKRVVSLFIIATMILSMLSAFIAVPVMAINAPFTYSEDGLWNAEGNASMPIYYGTTLNVTGSGVTAGETVNIYWDFVQAAYLLNTTTAGNDGRYTCFIDVPSAYNGSHYIWAKDLSTGISERSVTYLNVYSKLVLSPDAGLADDEVTVKGYGFGANEEVVIAFYNGTTAVPDYSVSLYDAADEEETDAKGYFSLTFDVPMWDDDAYLVNCSDESAGYAEDGFTIGPALTIDKDFGPCGTVVKIDGRGFTGTTEINSYDDITLDGVIPVYSRDHNNVTTTSAGAFTIYVVIPSAKIETHNLTVDDGLGKSASTEFEIDGNATVEITPEYGTPGTVLTVKGYNFTRISGTDVDLTLESQEVTATTDATGSFTASITIPPLDFGEMYGVNATDEKNCIGSTEVLVALIVLQLSDYSAPVGAEVTLMGSGFSDGKDWNATLGDLDLIATQSIAGGQTYFSKVWYVPSVPAGTYTINVLDIDKMIEVGIDFTVTDPAALSLSRADVPNGYNLTIEGVNFAELDGVDTQWYLYNSTHAWNLNDHPNVTISDPGAAVPTTDEDGEILGYYLIPEFLELGTYTINCTTVPSDSEYPDVEQYAEAVIEIVPEEVILNVGNPSYARGQTITFVIKATLKKDGFELGIKDPDGSEVFNSTWATIDWKTIGAWFYIPSNLQIDDNINDVYSLPADAMAGTWTYAFWTADKNYATGTFQVTELTEIEQLQQDIGGVASSVLNLGTSVIDLATSLVGVSGAAANAAAAAASAATASADAQAAAEAAMAAVADVGDTASDALDAANDARTSADLAKDAADSGLAAALNAQTTAQTAADAANDAADAAEGAQQAASGLTTLVYGAIGASLIAALAAIVSLMQISRRIAG